MGFFKNVGNRVRGFFGRDKEQAQFQLARGTGYSTYPGQELLHAYGYDSLAEYLRLDTDLLGRFIDYEAMDEYPELASALDIYADDVCQPDSERKRSVWVESRDSNVLEVLDELFLKTLRLDEEVWTIARTVAKYGNDYEEILISDAGVIGLNFLPPATMRRIEGQKGELYGFVQDFKGGVGYSPQDFFKLLTDREKKRSEREETPRSPPYLDVHAPHDADRVIPLEPWEVVHIRLNSKFRRSSYGHSVMESARWLWRRLLLLEDAALIYRLQRAPERYVFYVDVGDLPPQQAVAYVNKVRQQHKKRRYVNPATGKLDLKYEPLSQDDDFFVPVRKGVEGTRIETLGSANWQHMDDVEYFRDKLFSAMKIPKTYLGLEEGVVRSILSNEDVRFARTVLRVQRELRNGFSKICRVHLASLNISPFDAEYDVQMAIPSSIFELAQVEVQNARAGLASALRDSFSLYWILSKIFHLSDRDIQMIFKQREEDAVREAVAQAKGQAEAAKLMPQPDAGGGMPPGLDALAGGASGAPPGAPPGPPGPPPGAGAPGPAEGPNMLPQMESRRRKRGFSEEELFRGQDREAEKRAEDKLDKLLAHDVRLARRIQEVQGLLHELRSSIPSGKR